jgi:predicted nucleic acid-binding protein
VVGTSPLQGLPSERERIGIDTNIFIYFLEAHPRYGAWCASLFDRIERGHNPAVTSTVTLLELLVQPYRDQKEELAQKIFAVAST